MGGKETDLLDWDIDGVLNQYLKFVFRHLYSWEHHVLHIALWDRSAHSSNWFHERGFNWFLSFFCCMCAVNLFKLVSLHTAQVIIILSTNVDHSCRSLSSSLSRTGTETNTCKSIQPPVCRKCLQSSHIHTNKHGYNIVTAKNKDLHMLMVVGGLVGFLWKPPEFNSWLTVCVQTLVSVPVNRRKLKAENGNKCFASPSRDGSGKSCTTITGFLCCCFARAPSLQTFRRLA